jgi:hypothetical protein
MRTRFIPILAPSLAVLSALLVAPAAHAVGEEEASATGKGITGGALLGAEAVMLVEAALDVKPAWAYIVGGLAGAVGGGVGGYFAEQGDDPRLSLFLLAGGMTLAIPTTVAVLSTTAYDPPADYVQDRAPEDEPVAEPPRPSESGAEPAPSGEAPPPTSRAPVRRSTKTVALYRPYAPPALVGLTPDALTLGIPAVEVRGAYSRREMFQYGVSQETEVRVPVVNFAF